MVSLFFQRPELSSCASDGDIFTFDCDGAGEAGIGCDKSGEIGRREMGCGLGGDEGGADVDLFGS